MIWADYFFVKSPLAKSSSMMWALVRVVHCSSKMSVKSILMDLGKFNGSLWDDGRYTPLAVKRQGQGGQGWSECLHAKLPGDLLNECPDCEGRERSAALFHLIILSSRVISFSFRNTVFPPLNNSFSDLGWRHLNFL